MKKLFASPDSKFHDMATARHRPFPLPRPLASLPTTLCAFLAALLARNQTVPKGRE